MPRNLMLRSLHSLPPVISPGDRRRARRRRTAGRDRAMSRAMMDAVSMDTARADALARSWRGRIRAAWSRVVRAVRRAWGA